MFIQNLDKKQQSILLHLAKEVMSADNELHELEGELLSLLQAQVEPSVFPEAISLDKLDSFFESNQSKVSLLLELIGVAHADGDYHDNEKVLIHNYALTLNIPEHKLLELENWVSKQLSLSLEAQKLLAD